MQVLRNLFAEIFCQNFGVILNLGVENQFMKKIALSSLLFVLIACNGNQPDHDGSLPEHRTNEGIPAPKDLTHTILAEHPHDTGAYTQGLELYNGKMYEGTGDFEQSSIRITDWKTGNVEQSHNMGSNKIFGEGITIFNGKIYQLTWQSNLVYVYDLKDITKPIKTFNWPNEGWGLTHNATDLIISDGSSNIYFVDPETFKIKNTIGVESNRGPVDDLNELEYVNGFIYANVYQTDYIVKIDQESGHVVGLLDFKGLLPQIQHTKRTDVLNGIAYDSASKMFYITGKRWPKLYEVKIAD